ncbi:Efflux pump vrtL [Paramyrothecium foliicola]|nr:Efflux pump vrtL [Paramyrothecium foliicola]
MIHIRFYPTFALHTLVTSNNMEPQKSLSRANSRSTIWRPWTPGLTSLTGYEKSLYKYPWLDREDDPPPEDDFLLRRATPLPPLSEMEVANWNYGQLSGRQDPEQGSCDGSAAESVDECTPDPNIVSWDGPDDPANPHNWSRHKKWYSTILVSCFTFISPVSSTMLAPALPVLAEDFNTSSGFETYLIMSIFLLAYAVGPFILAPLSEMYGRVVVLQAANMVFLIFNTVCGFAQTKTQILLFRFLSGLGGSAPQALGGGVLSDCWRKEERGTATAIYSLAPFLGPAIGPIAGGYLTQYMNWRWVFWVVSMADAGVQILAFLFLNETYAPKILGVKAKRLRKETGNKSLHTEYENPDRTFPQLLRKNLMRPFIMLFTQPTIQLTGLYRAYLYGLMYFVLASFPLLWEEQYDQEPGRASLNYLSLGVGFVIGLFISGPLIDKVYALLKIRYNDPGRPEFRVPLMFPTALITPAGLLLYGLSAHFRLHWIVPNIGAAIFAAGLILSFQCAQTYIVDSYERYAASATGAAAFMRTMAGFGFPLFAPSLYQKLGFAWGNGVLAGAAVVICLAAPMVMWKWGEALRRRSQYCAG